LRQALPGYETEDFLVTGAQRFKSGDHLAQLKTSR